eukprot:GFUD01010746.1.p1 GENE.GFUD01010746.1~~GFUD01010746.1.p1  ORF type:complete len:271 (+),score=91.60 GFUD01010746.1:114-926(+)
MGKGNIGIMENRSTIKIEKIRELKEKYGTEQDIEVDGECDYSSLVITEEIEITDDIDTKLSDINQELNPCIDELFRIQKEIDNLKRKFKTPFEYIEKDKNHIKENDNDIEAFSTENLAVSLQFARLANERDIQHMVCDTKGNDYELQNIIREVDQMGRERYKAREKKRRGMVGCEVREGMFVRVKAVSDSESTISIAGIDLMKQLGLTRNDLQTCIDTIRTQGEEKLELVGERVLALSGDQMRTLTRVVFVINVKGFHLSWFIARELGMC